MNRIIAYDIAHPRRLRRAHRLLSNIALPLQNSVFLFHGTDEAFAPHYQALCRLLNPHEDDLRVYLLHGRLYRLGRSTLPEGIYWSAFPETALDGQPYEALE